MASNSRRTSTKRIHADNSLESVSDQTHLVEIARGSYEFKTANLEAKRQKMELKLEQERDSQRYAAQERALVLKQQMQEKEFAHKERMMQYKLELAQLKVGQPPAALGAHPISFGQPHEGHSANIYPTGMGFSSFPQDSFTFSTDAACSTTTLPPPAWGSSGASTS